MADIEQDVQRQIIDRFIESYTREVDHYQQAARLCQERCELLLGPRGIKAIVTHRAKNPAKLLAKLLARSKAKPYESADDIRNDVVDLAGVRIALYFPGDRTRVEELIANNFLVEEKRVFPIVGKVRPGKRFDGYHATHFRIFLQPTSLPEDQKRYSTARIEIQLGSVVMHAWAEVEHDLVYKPESGELSEDEHAILDELNGMILAGEIALERLQKALERRLSVNDVTFDSHYELAAYLHKAVIGKAEARHLQMGRVDALWELLKKAEMTSPESLSRLLEELDFTAIEVPLADQITEAVLSVRPELSADFVSAQTKLPGPSAYSLANALNVNLKVSIGDFLSSWIVLERALGEISKSKNMSGKVAPFRDSRLTQLIELQPSAKADLDRLRKIRNNLVHGIEVPSGEYLQQAILDIENLIRTLESHPDPQVQIAVTTARRAVGDTAK